MTDLSDIIGAGSVIAALPAASKRALFAGLGRAAGEAFGLDAAMVAERLAQREKLGTTGFGGGVAVPHAKIEGIGQVRGVFARLPQPLGYGAVDALPVDIAIMLLSPPEAGADHLKALARVSRALRDRGFAAKLRGAASRDALVALLSGVESRDAA